MARIVKFNYRFIVCFFTGLIIGIIIGISIFTILVSYRIDNYHQKIRKLETAVEEKNTRLKKLEKQINKNYFILQNVKVKLVNKKDDIDEIAFKKHIKDKYNSLLGKQIKKIDLNVVREIIDKRIFKLNKKEYKLTVTKLILSETLKIWVEVNQVQN